MKPFEYVRALSAEEALGAAANDPGSAYLAGGTTLLDLMKQGVEGPAKVIDISAAKDMTNIEISSNGALRVGASATLAHIAHNEDARTGWPLLVEAVRKGLTPQLRNAATIGGNLTQRPRCIYFREADFDCNKRRPGSGCAARTGVHFDHAVFGGSDACIAVHPSDLCVALTALDAEVELRSRARGARVLPIGSYHRLPDGDPTRETNRDAGELVTAVSIPPQKGWRGAYVKAPREGFALASAAVLLRIEAGRVREARIVLGGVAHKPWPVPQAAGQLIGRAPEPAAFGAAAEAAALGAAFDEQTAFRQTLIREVTREALIAAGVHRSET